MHVFAQRNRLIQRPGRIRVHSNTRLREAFFQCPDRFYFDFTRLHAAFKFEIFKTVFILCRFRQLHHFFVAHGLLMTQVIPRMLPRLRLSWLIIQIGFLPVGNIKQITEHRHFIALFTGAEQLRHRLIEKLPHQIQQCGFQNRDGIVMTFEIPRPEARQHRFRLTVFLQIPFVQIAHQLIHDANFLPDDMRDGIIEDLQHHAGGGRFAHAGMSGTVFEHQQNTGEITVMCTGNVQQHAVVTGDRNDLHFDNFRRIRHDVLAPFPAGRDIQVALACGEFW
ncbi:hypothetical protein SRABI106_01121 [Rahnella aquatilis]|nr:hypothetical protein SRABI106_01121 [Rahnella aquatilis]